MKYYPEGVNRSLNKKMNSVDEIKSAMRTGEIIEGRVVLCDREHNLHIDMGALPAIIPHNEGAIGIAEGTTKDIALISKVNKSVCFRIIGFHRDDDGRLCSILSRRAVQLDCMRDYIDKLGQGDVIDAKVTHIESFGAFIDIGAGINSLIPIDMLSVSRISHPSERVYEGQLIRAVLKKRDGDKLTFSVKELLGTWEQNAALFCVGETVTGVVRSIEEYGVFVELTPNLAGLAEPCEGLKVGQRVSVYIKSVIADKMKIKLVIVEAFNEAAPPCELVYYNDERHIDYWKYSTDKAPKSIETQF